MQSQNIENILYFCYLTACGVHQTTPDVSNIGKAELAKLYSFGKAHSLTALIYNTLECSNVFAAYPELKEKWKSDRDNSIRKNILLDAQRKRLEAFLTENKIWYVPLKGSMIRAFYPKFEMRQMSDCDILFDSNFRHAVKEYFENCGYTVKSYSTTCHDKYMKPPVYNFEMHVSLFNILYKPHWNEYFDNIHSRLIKAQSGSYEYKMTDEDFYLYFIAHSGKHYNECGIGLKFLVDLYFILKNYKEELDWSYVSEKLRYLELDDFEKTAKSLCTKLFASPVFVDKSCLDDAELEMLRYISKCGTYGVKTNKYKNELKRIDNSGSGSTKRKYYISRLFPDKGWYLLNCPFCAKHVWTRPFYTCWRVIRAVLFRREKIKKEYKIISSSCDTSKS